MWPYASLLEIKSLKIYFILCNYRDTDLSRVNFLHRKAKGSCTEVCVVRPSVDSFSFLLAYS